jgi:hypothetical protein
MVTEGVAFLRLALSQCQPQWSRAQNLSIGSQF